MERVGINTAQNITINYRVASIGDRILATFLDYLIFLAYFLIIILIASFEFWPGKSESMAFWLLTSLPILFYDLGCELLMNGQSFGKYLMKIKVIKLDGSQPNFGGYLLRWLFRIIDTMSFSGMIALVTIIINGKGQRLGDIAAGTTVIKIAKRLSLNSTILKDLKEDYKISFTEVEHLTDKEITIIKNAVSYGLEHRKWEVINKTSDKVKETLKITTDIKPLPFLKTIIKDYTHFEFNR